MMMMMILQSVVQLRGRLRPFLEEVQVGVIIILINLSIIIIILINLTNLAILTILANIAILLMVIILRTPGLLK